MSEVIQFPSGDEIVPGVIERPEGAGPWPGVLVVHEWWGQIERHLKS
jgi:dienelactone hydrolase